MFRFTLVCFISLLGGCASQYIPPTEGDYATVRFIADVQTNIFTSDEPGCLGRIYQIDSINNMLGISSAINSLDMPMVITEKLSPNEYTEVKVPASKPFVVYFRQVRTGLLFTSFCNYSFNFTPEHNGLYQIKSIAKGDECEALVQKIEESDAGEFFLVRENTMEEHEEMCKF